MAQQFRIITNKFVPENQSIESFSTTSTISYRVSWPFHWIFDIPYSILGFFLPAVKPVPRNP